MCHPGCRDRLLHARVQAHQRRRAVQPKPAKGLAVAEILVGHQGSLHAHPQMAVWTRAAAASSPCRAAAAAAAPCAAAAGSRLKCRRNVQDAAAALDCTAMAAATAAVALAARLLAAAPPVWLCAAAAPERAPSAGPTPRHLPVTELLHLLLLAQILLRPLSRLPPAAAAAALAALTSAQAVAWKGWQRPPCPAPAAGAWPPHVHARALQTLRTPLRLQRCRALPGRLLPPRPPCCPLCGVQLLSPAYPPAHSCT